MVSAINCGGRLPPPVEDGGIYQARIAEAVFSIAGEASEDRTLFMRVAGEIHQRRGEECERGHKENRSSILVRESRYALTNLTMTSTQVVLR